jgi:hypothetical protein
VSRSCQTIGIVVLIVVHLPGWAVAQMAVLPAGSALPTPGPSGNPGSGPCPTPEQTACSNGVLGKFVNGVFTPVSFLSGGLISSPCASGAVNPADLRQPADSLDGAAARIKKDEAEAGTRRANVHYLGTVDCLRYPEAEKVLIAALRSDHNEGVRLEAALVLGRGCCCTPKTIAALELTATGSDRDGNPPERSAGVRQLASAALDFCRNRVTLPNPQLDEKPAGIPRPLPPLEASGVVQTAWNQSQVNQPPPATKSVTVPAPTTSSAKAAAVTEDHPPTTGKRGLFDIIERAFAPR